jgi:3-oxoacyl-[acyl-carrier-protein] synthase III
VTVLREVSAYRPPAVPLDALGERLGLTRLQVRTFQRLYGLDRIAMDDAATWPDLLLSAAAGLSGLAAGAARVRYVLAARVVPFAVPRNQRPLLDVCAKLGLPHAVSFAVTEYACASGLLAVDLAGRLLADDGDPDALALVFTGEKAFAPEVQVVPETTVMAEGAAACLVSATGPGDRVLSYVTHTRGEFYRQQSDPAVAARFRDEYPAMVAGVMHEAVAAAGLDWPDIRLVLPHNVNRVSWVQIAKLAGVPLDRIHLAGVPAAGHCFAADPFLNHVAASDTGTLVPGQPYLMVAAGLGAVASAMVLRHRADAASPGKESP